MCLRLKSLEVLATPDLKQADSVKMYGTNVRLSEEHTK